MGIPNSRNLHLLFLQMTFCFFILLSEVTLYLSDRLYCKCFSSLKEMIYWQSYEHPCASNPGYLVEPVKSQIRDLDLSFFPARNTEKARQWEQGYIGKKNGIRIVVVLSFFLSFKHFMKNSLFEMHDCSLFFQEALKCVKDANYPPRSCDFQNHGWSILII